MTKKPNGTGPARPSRWLAAPVLLASVTVVAAGCSHGDNTSDDAKPSGPKQYHLAAVPARLPYRKPQAGRDFLKAQVVIEQSLQPRFPDVQVADLQAAWRDILQRARLNAHHLVSREQLSVREHMGIILRALQEKGGFVQFETLFDPDMGVPSLVVHFIAMLELGREKLIEITQAEPFQPIYVRVHHGGTEPGQESA